ncbi:MAG: AmmeMemoRadiSam system protein A [Anaerolineae bacterium]|jgi:AmmeMemoRadiSam system protein A
MTLSREERRYLLNLARASIARAVESQDLPLVDLATVTDRLRRDGASFVTLKKDQRLRGCIGSLEARRPLVLDVQENAAAAAIRDPRFPAVRPEEIDDVDIEISVLSRPQLLDYESFEDLCDKLRPGEDGVVIERGWHRATFLPQVWEKLPDEGQFLHRLCLKAGLSPGAYACGDIDVCTYQVEKFEEE